MLLALEIGKICVLGQSSAVPQILQYIAHGRLALEPALIEAHQRYVRLVEKRQSFVLAEYSDRRRNSLKHGGVRTYMALQFAFSVVQRGFVHGVADKAAVSGRPFVERHLTPVAADYQMVAFALFLLHRPGPAGQCRAGLCDNGRP